MSERSKIKGMLSVDIFVECPACGEWGIDLFHVDYLNDEGQLWNVIQSNEWEGLALDFDCPKCKAELTFDSMEY